MTARCCGSALHARPRRSRAAAVRPGFSAGRAGSGSCGGGISYDEPSVAGGMVDALGERITTGKSSEARRVLVVRAVLRYAQSRWLRMLYLEFH